jgi:hypothetical protein
MGAGVADIRLSEAERRTLRKIDESDRDSDRVRGFVFRA